MANDPSSQPTQPLTDAERCQPVYVHAYGLDRETWEKLFDRVADAAHALDEAVSCSGGNECALCVEQPTREELSAEVDRLQAENTAQAASLDQFRSFPTEPGPGEWSTSYRMGYADAGRDVRALVRALGLDQDGNSNG